MDLEAQKVHFKNHVASFTDYGNIKILDFNKPGSSFYRIRFLFEEDYCRLHISGDLGELIASNYNNMTYEKFSDFVDDVEYFKEKIDCHSRPVYRYDEDKARTDLLKIIEDLDLKNAICDAYDWQAPENAINSVIDDILEDFDSNSGITSKGYDVASDYITDFYEFAIDIGREETGILDFYMLAFKLAQEQLEGGNV